MKVEDFERRAGNRRGKIQSILREPRASAVKGLERILVGKNSFQTVITRNYQDNLAIDHEFIVRELLKGSEVVERNSDLQFSIDMVHDVLICVKTGIIRIHSGHLYAPHRSDREFMSGQFAGTMSNLLARNVEKYSKIEEKNIPNFVLAENKFYYHFVVEELPRLLLAIERFPSLRIVSTKNQPKYVYDFFEDLSLDIRFVEHPINLENCILVSSPNYRLTENRRRFLLEQLDQKYRGMISKEQDNNLALNVLISRKNAMRYDESVEQKIQKQMANENYLKVELSKLKFSDQIVLFTKTKYATGIHGGGFTNGLFMKKGGRIEEFFTQNHVPYFYGEIAKLSGLDYSARNISEFSAEGDC